MARLSFALAAAAVLIAAGVANASHAPAEKAASSSKHDPVQVNELKSALLLSWLKESGAYTLLNGTLPSNQLVGRLQAELERPKGRLAEAAAAVDGGLSDAAALKHAAAITWLKKSGLLDALARVENRTGLPVAHLVPQGTVSAASVTPAGGDGAPAPGGLFSHLHVPHVPGSGALGNLTRGGLDRLKSLVLLSWLKESGTYDKLQAINNATAALQEKLKATAEGTSVASAAAALKAAQKRADAALVSANELAANVTSQLAALRAAAKGKAGEGTKAAQAALEAKLKQANEALSAASKEAQRLGDEKLAAAAAATGGLDGVLSTVAGAMQSHVDAATAALKEVQKQAATLKASLGPKAAKSTFKAG